MVGAIQTINSLDSARENGNRKKRKEVNQKQTISSREATLERVVSLPPF
jgi:hypothetical protein